MKTHHAAVDSFSLKGMKKILYHDIVSSISEPFHIIDEKYRILWVSQSGRFSNAVGRICHDLYQQRDMPCSECPISQVFLTQKSCVMEKELCLPDKTHRWVEVRAYPVVDDGKILYVLKIGYDITRKKQDFDNRRRHAADLEKALREISKEKSHPVKEVDNNGIRINLTSREFQILRLLSQGLSNTKIAQTLCISPHTVKSHVISIFNKLGVNDRTQAAVRASRLRLI